MYDLIIIGMGISGISAAIYAKNSNLKVLMLERDVPGGLLNKINTIHNYPGYAKVNGPDLSLELFNSVNEFNIPYKIAEVKNISVKNDKKIIETNHGVFESKYVIIATGRKNKRLGLSNEEKLLGHGISTCALCDGNLYKDKEIAVVGGGNSALEEAIYLSAIAKKVYLIHRRDLFRGDGSLVEKIKENQNIEILYNSNVTSIVEENNKLTGIMINQTQPLSISALFLYIGFEPSCSFAKDLEITNKEGYIEVNEKYETKIPGIFAVGDCIKKDIYQLITAANDGVVATIHIIKEMESTLVKKEK